MSLERLPLTGSRETMATKPLGNALMSEVGDSGNTPTINAAHCHLTRRESVQAAGASEYSCAVSQRIAPASFATIQRRWCSGDKAELVLPKRLDLSAADDEHPDFRRTLLWVAGAVWDGRRRSGQTASASSDAATSPSCRVGV